MYNLSNSIIFNNLSTEEIEIVLECLTAFSKSYKKSDVIYMANDIVTKIGILLSGEITVYKNYLDDELTEVRRILPYETFGQENIYAGLDKSNYTLIASKNAEIMYLNGKKLIDDSSLHCVFRTQMNINMLKFMCETNLKQQNQIELRAVSSLKDRVLTYLKEISNATDDKYFNVELNREQMAKYFGATRPAVSKVLMELKNDGVIDYDNKMFVLKF